MLSHLFIGRIFNVSTEFLIFKQEIVLLKDNLLGVMAEKMFWLCEVCPPLVNKGFLNNWIDTLDLSSYIFSLMFSLLFSQCNSLSMGLLYVVLIQCFQNEKLYSSFQWVFNYFVFLILLTFILSLFIPLSPLKVDLNWKGNASPKHSISFYFVFFSTPWKPNKSVSPHINVICSHLSLH